MSEAKSEYLVQFGCAAHLGRFRNLTGTALARGARVVVAGARGLELGEVLGPADTAHARRLAAVPDGDLVRAATADDEAEADRIAARVAELLPLAERFIDEMGLPLAVLDLEILLDGQALLHAVHWAECDATPLFERLSAAAGLAVKLHDLTRPAGEKEEPAGCGSGGCGSGGCGNGGCGSEKGGCSSGSCSKGSVKSAEELTAYFADLRRQMEQANLVRTPLAVSAGDSE